MWQLSEAIDGMTEACRAFGVPVRRRQRQPLQRVAGRATSTRPRWSGCSAWSTASTVARPASAWSTAAAWCWSARPCPSWPARSGPPTTATAARHAAGARPGRGRTPRRRPCATLVAAGLRRRRPRRRRGGGLGARPGRDGGPLRASASPSPGSPTTPRCSRESPGRARAVRRPRPARGSCSTCSRPAACPTAASASPAATAWSVKDLFDLPLAERRRAPGATACPTRSAPARRRADHGDDRQVRADAVG